jgi:cytochrome d ubiquinol oxidase subunit II
VAVGFFALALFAFLAAVYRTLEATDRQLREDFRRRLLWSGALVGLMALLVFELAEPVHLNCGDAGWKAPGLGPFKSRQRSPPVWRILLSGGAATGALRGNRAIEPFLWGWAIAQRPNLIMPDVSIYDTAAPAPTLRLLTAARPVRLSCCRRLRICCEYSRRTRHAHDGG